MQPTIEAMRHYTKQYIGTGTSAHGIGKPGAVKNAGPNYEALVFDAQMRNKIIESWQHAKVRAANFDGYGKLPILQSCTFRVHHTPVLAMNTASRRTACKCRSTMS